MYNSSGGLLLFFVLFWNFVGLTFVSQVEPGSIRRSLCIVRSGMGAALRSLQSLDHETQTTIVSRLFLCIVSLSLRLERLGTKYKRIASGD
ncbi:hypothetical protein K491DRAFT_318184 [Lophiostoma macrostomum CBS 122681]|uniref:Uncharacterized protein n=1 Tax=Lophiostoma macrostomum CBS 122681 TaxID=1314788 RepID=A0A6A6TE94_9PLEO|nr:hypothetical protein K491DRAFT_318184 [Lophiostoma macrostomum CBS 122681]